MNEVVNLHDEEKQKDINYDLIQKKLDETVGKGKYIITYCTDEGAAEFFYGKNLLLGDLIYLQKVINVKVDKLVTHNLLVKT